MLWQTLCSVLEEETACAGCKSVEKGNLFSNFNFVPQTKIYLFFFGANRILDNK